MRPSRRLVVVCSLGALWPIVTTPAGAAAPGTTPAQTPATAPAEELVDNPQYAHWNKFNTGSASTLLTTIDMSGQKIVTETTNTLLEKNAEKVVLEVSGSMEMGGNKQIIPPQKQEIAARVEKQDIRQLAGEKMEAAGQTFDCTVYEMNSPDPKQQGKAKAWTSDKVPGGVVKIEAKTPTGTVVSTLQSFEVK